MRIGARWSREIKLNDMFIPWNHSFSRYSLFNKCAMTSRKIQLAHDIYCIENTQSMGKYVMSFQNFKSKFELLENEWFHSNYF
jgi:hypothetical protein